MYYRKVDEIFKNVPNVFGIADDILVAGYDIDGKDHDKMLQKVLQICRWVNLKLTKTNPISDTQQSHFWWNHIQALYETWPTKA